MAQWQDVSSKDSKRVLKKCMGFKYTELSVTNNKEFEELVLNFNLSNLHSFIISIHLYKILKRIPCNIINFKFNNRKVFSKLH
ncbi:hypothetical protein ACJX0J_041981, partial [Zea mays]